MSEENKNIVRSFVEDAWGDGRMEAAAVEKYFAVDCVCHNLPPGLEGREGYKQLLNMFAAVTKDRQGEVMDGGLIAEGDKVVQRWSSTMTHSGEFMGLPATNRQFTVTGINIYRVANGKIVELWSEMDIAGMMQQLGAMG